jgi:hypothetical protein
VDISSLTEKANSEKKITLKPEFSWFLSEEFQKLREAFDSDGDNELEAETKREEKYPLTNQKNENSDSVTAATEEVWDDSVEHEEKLPLTNANFASNNQQLEEENNDNESGLEEKLPLTIDDNSSLPNNNTPDLSDNSSRAGLEPIEEVKEIKFSLNYEEKDSILACF